MWKTRYLLIRVSMTLSVIWMMLPLISSWMIRSDSSDTKRPILNPLATKNFSGSLPKSRMAAFLSLPSRVMRFRFSRMVSVLSSIEMPDTLPANHRAPASNPPFKVRSTRKIRKPHSRCCLLFSNAPHFSCKRTICSSSRGPDSSIKPISLTIPFTFNGFNIINTLTQFNSLNILGI